MMVTQMVNWWTKSTGRMADRLLSAVIMTTFVALFSVAAHAKTIHIVAFGDSLTAGYNLRNGLDFATQLEAALRKKGHDVKVSNAGVSGDTTSGGLARFDWAIPADTDAVVLELGANDALRGISPAIARKNLSAILDKLKGREISVLLAGMRAPANWGEAYVKAFGAMYPELAEAHGTLLYPFFMAGVIDRDELKLSDALHPNGKGVAEIVRRILPLAERLLEQVKLRRK